MTKKTTTSDPIDNLIGLITIVKTSEKIFSARLISATDRELWFESRAGAQWMIAREAIVSIWPGKQVPKGAI
jgi:hypothetical protein